MISSKKLKQHTRTNSKYILRKFSSLDKWCKSLSPISWGVLYSLKVHTKGINQFLYGIQPDLSKIKNEIIRLKQLHPKWTEEDILIDISIENKFNTVFGDYMTTMLVCKAANRVNPKEHFLQVLWNEPQLRRFVWDVSSMVNCKSLEKQMFVKNYYNQLVCLYTIRECLRIFISIPRNNIDMVVKHGGAKIPTTIPSTIIHKSFLSTDYLPSDESMWTIFSKNKHVIYIPADAHIPVLFIEACIHGEEHEIMLPPGIQLHYTVIKPPQKDDNNSKLTIIGATASILPKYWIGINGLTQIKPTNGPYIMVDWKNGNIVDTLPKYKMPTSFEEFEKCVKQVFPSECVLTKTPVNSGSKTKHVLKLLYHAIK